MRASVGLPRWPVLATIAAGLVVTHCNRRLDEGSEAAAMTSASGAPSGTCTSTEYAKCESPAVQTVLKWFSATTSGEKAAMSTHRTRTRRSSSTTRAWSFHSMSR